MTTENQRKSRENLIPFKKGQSGNPKGRPKKGLRFPDILEKIGAEEVEITIEGKKLKMPKEEIIMRKVYSLALKGEKWCVEFIANRTEGLPIQTTRVQNIDPDEIVIIE